MVLSSVLSYSITIVVSVLLVSKSSERLSLTIVLGFYLCSPYIRNTLPLFDENPQDFYAFYAVYEVLLLIALSFLNLGNERLPKIYLLSFLMVGFNYYIYYNFSDAYWQTEYYPLINKACIDLTILLIASSLSRRGVAVVSSMLIFSPTLLNVLNIG